MTTTVEDALAASHNMMTVREIMRQTGHDEEFVRAELKRLARAEGALDHIPGRGRYDGRYGLLRPIEKAAVKEFLTVQPADADSEGGETDVTPATHAPRALRLTAAAQADRDEFESEFGHEGNCSCHISAPCRSCTHPGNPIQQDADECWEPDVETDIVGVIVERVKANADELDPEIVRAAAHVERNREYQGLQTVIADIRAAVGDKTGKIMLGELAAHIGKLHELGEAHRETCMNWERSMMAAIGEDGVVSVAAKIAELKGELTNARALTSKLEHLLGAERTATAALREQLDHITTGGGPERAGLCASLIDSYAVVAPKRPMRRFTGHDSAVKSAMAAASNGSKRGEVFALVHIGTAKRGAVWRIAK